MNYDQKLIEYLKNTEGNVYNEWTTNTSPFSDLASQGIEMAKKSTDEGRIAALFIFNQLTIEMAKLLINYCNFYLQICIYPNKITFKNLNNSNKYSEIINELKFKNSFKNKNNFIHRVEKLNKLRNEYGHSLIGSWWSQDREKELAELGNNFEEIFELWKTALIDLRAMIDKEKQKPEIIELGQKKLTN